jgi:Mrp family chromosome partitioning ATPase/capsular polysaccharide biosynthesis protein
MRPEGGQQDHSTLRDYLHVVRRRKWIILQALVLLPLVAVALEIRQEPVYQASADVLLSRQNLAATLNGIPDPSTYYIPERLAQTQAELARVPEVARRVVDAAGIEGRTAYGLLASSSVIASPTSDILTFSVSDFDQSVAPRLATEYARQFTRYRSEIESASVVRAREEATKRINELEQNGQADTPLYASLVEKEQQLRTIEALQTSTSFLVRPAEGAFQIEPRPFRSGLMGLLVGIVLGVGLAFLREALDTRVRSTNEIERLGLPLLARLPEPPRRLRSRNKLVMLAEPDSVQAEAFRMLRTNLEFADVDRHARVIMVTSAVEGEGKSTTAANLAIGFARAGRRVVLVDLDLRKPIIERFFRLRGRPGLTQVVLGHASVDDALVSVPLAVGGPNGAGPTDGRVDGLPEGRLEVLGSGPIPPNVGEFVQTDALARVVDALRERADVVIVDSPPLLHVGDARFLSSRVDAILLIARLNVLRRPMIKEVGRVLESCPAHKLGFIVTGAQEEAGYGYGSYYRAYERRSRAKEPVA